MVKIVRLVFNLYAENTYVVFDDLTFDAVVIDPGASDQRERGKLAEYIENNHLNVKYVMATHAHFDHVMAHNEICEKFGAKFAMSPVDMVIDECNRDFAKQANCEYPKLRQIDLPLRDGDIVDVGPIHIEVIETPGHTPGGLSFYLPSEKALFTGDTLFKGSIGRTDFQFGSYPDLMKSIIRKLMTLPMDTDVLPGHGDITSLASERDGNPFVNDVLSGDVDATI